MWKISERKTESYKIWVMAILLAGACLLLCYFHVILGIGTVITHIFYIPIVLAAVWWKRKGLLVALFSSGFLTFSHVFLRPNVATANDYFRAFMFVATAFVVAELSRRITKKEEEQLRAANQQLGAGEQQLRATNQQLRASEQQLRAANQQLRAGEQQLKASNQQLRANEQQLICEIAERKQAEEALRENEERLTKALQASPNLMGIIDLDEQRRLLVNEAFARITGYSVEEVEGTTLDELNFWIKPDRVNESFRLLRQNGILQNYEADIRTKQGEIRTLRYHGALLDIPGKNVITFSAEDITEQREAEKRIKEHQAQLKSLASELSLAEERERRRIAAGLHDDIAQKLAMSKFCQLMDQVVADARSLTFELSNPVLYQVGLEAAVESYLAERIQGQFGIKCKFKSEGPQSSLEEDIRVVLFQAVRELLTNVVKHANASTVEVYVSNTEDMLRIVVEDDGVGFDPTEIGPHPAGRGGFGLFNIRERLEYLGGNVKIESERKKGARVTMTVAIRMDAAAEQKEMLP
jgi:PAS domain S-box-containing protein